MTESAHIYDVRIIRIDADARDVLRFLEAHVLPRLARVARLPDTVAVRDVATNRCFASAGPDNIGIGLLHRDRADGAAEVRVRDGERGLTAVGGLEDTTASGAHVVLVGARG